MGLAESIVGVVAIAAVVFVALVALRRVMLSRAGGFDVIWRRGDDPSAHGWSLGQARYRGGQLALYRALSPLPFAALSLQRSSLSLGVARSPDEREAPLMPPGVVIIPGTSGGATFELALSIDALTMLRSWVESRPPGATAHPDGHLRDADDSATPGM